MKCDTVMLQQLFPFCILSPRHGALYIWSGRGNSSLQKDPIPSGAKQSSDSDTPIPQLTPYPVPEKKSVPHKG